MVTIIPSSGADASARTAPKAREMSSGEPPEERVIYRERFQGVHFDFRGKRFTGLFQTSSARGLAAEQVVEANIVDTLSALYVARYSSEETRARAVEIAGNASVLQ